MSLPRDFFRSPLGSERTSWSGRGPPRPVQAATSKLAGTPGAGAYVPSGICRPRGSRVDLFCMFASRPHFVRLPLVHWAENRPVLFAAVFQGLCQYTPSQRTMTSCVNQPTLPNYHPALGTSDRCLCPAATFRRGRFRNSSISGAKHSHRISNHDSGPLLIIAASRSGFSPLIPTAAGYPTLHLSAWSDNQVRHSPTRPLLFATRCSRTQSRPDNTRRRYNQFLRPTAPHFALAPCLQFFPSMT